MKVIEIKKNALEITQEDWNHLGSLLSDFSHICKTNYCDNCPLSKFCDTEIHNPAVYLQRLYDFLDNP